MASSTQQQFQNVLSKLEKKDKEGVTKDEAYTAASIAPVTGDAIAIKELPDDVKQIKTLFEEGYKEADFKKLGMGALYTTAVTAGLIPVAGVFGRTAKSFLKPVIKKASDEMSSVFKTASGDMNMTPALAGDTPTINKSIADKEPTSSTILKKDDYQGKKVYHATAKNFKKFGFVSKDDAADIGFHVGTPVQAERRTRKKTGERTLPLQLRTTLKPARIPDLSSFKEPKRWLAEIAVSGKDKDLLRFLMQDPKDANLILDQVENKLPIKMNGTTYYMLPDAERMGMDKKLWKDLVLEAGRAIRVGLDTTKNYNDRKEWFETIKRVANKNGYDSYVYKNEYEVGSASPDDLAVQIKEAMAGKRDPKTIDVGKQSDSYMLLEEDQAKGVFGTKTKGDPDFMKNKGGLLLAEGGVTMNKQMEMFDDGGLKDEGGTVDPVSGNDVPPGSTQEEVRDDIPAQLSEGEFVFPADVVRFIGLEKLMQMRQKAKMGLKKMEEMGQMGNSEEATIPDDIPFDINDLDMEDEEQYNSETTEMAQGGVIKAATGTLVNTAPNTFTQQSQFANQQLPTTNTYTAPTIPAPTAAPVGGFTPQFSGQTSQSGQTVIPTFQNLLGNTDGRYDELREYRSESGMILKIPFVNGAPIYPIPEGYTFVDSEETKTEEVKTVAPTPRTTQVTQQDDGGDDPDGGGGAVDLVGDPLSYKSVFNPDALDKTLRKYASMQVGLGNMYDALARGFNDKVNVNEITLNSAREALKTIKASGLYGSNVNLGTLETYDRDNINSYLTNVSDSVQSLLTTTDADGNTTAITLETLENRAATIEKQAKAAGIDLTVLNKSTPKVSRPSATVKNPMAMRNYAKQLAYRAGILNKTIVDEFQKDKGVYAKDSQEAKDNIEEIKKNEAKAKENFAYAENRGEPIESSYDSSDYSPSTSFGGEQTTAEQQEDAGGSFAGDDPAFQKGGLLKKKKSKVKKMKRGGLASR